MSQEQPLRPQSDQVPIEYGDVFDAHGDLASKFIATRDEATAHWIENQVMGWSQRAGPTEVFDSAATLNMMKAGAVDRKEITDVVMEQGVAVTEVYQGGTHVITKRVGKKIVGEYADPNVPASYPGSDLDVTIGEALEATARCVGDKLIDQSDAAAIQAAETRATGGNESAPGGLAAQARAAATLNQRIIREEDKNTISDVLADSGTRLPSDKTVTQEDAQKVVEAEIRNKPGMNITRGGVASCTKEAARLNQYE